MTIITPTGDRPACFALAERWMARQTLRPARWIVVDDGATPTPTTMDQHVIRLPPRPTEHTLARNLAAGLAGVRGKLAVIEDDDWYAPTYLETMSRWLDDADMAGEGDAMYYRVDLPGWRCMGNHRHASLAATGLADATLLRRAAEAMTGEMSIDLALWRHAPVCKMVHLQCGLVTQLKAMPGRPGQTPYHSRADGWCDDPGGRWLRRRVGDADAEAILAAAQQK